MTAASRVIPFRPPLRRRVHEQVAEQLRDAILDGRFRPGEKLPPERELAAEFGVNRTSLREALKTIEGLGLISVRQGDGATVQALIDGSLEVLAPMIFRGDRVDTAMLTELREVMMPLLFEMTRLAIDRCRADEVTALRGLRARIADEALPREERFAAAREVIVLLSDMTRNRVWQMLARRTRALLASGPLREMRRRLRRDPGHLVPIIDAGLAALDAGRSEEALAALRRVITMLGEAADEVSQGAATPAKGDL
jgi:GntR family transcriptional repressor for pyruvate dehydrogenase complex